jgi:hypothetical protein
MRKIFIKTLIGFVIFVIVVQLLISCAPPTMTEYDVIGKVNASYRTEVLDVAEGIVVTRFYDSTTLSTCYVYRSSISCVK